MMDRKKVKTIAVIIAVILVLSMLLGMILPYLVKGSLG